MMTASASSMMLRVVAILRALQRHADGAARVDAGIERQ